MANISGSLPPRIMANIQDVRNAKKAGEEVHSAASAASYAPPPSYKNFTPSVKAAKPVDWTEVYEQRKKFKSLANAIAADEAEEAAEEAAMAKTSGGARKKRQTGKRRRSLRNKRRSSRKQRKQQKQKQMH